VADINAVELAAFTLAYHLVGLDSNRLVINVLGLKDQDDELIGDIEIMVRFVKPKDVEEAG
jgi:hypothetical protein